LIRALIILVAVAAFLAVAAGCEPGDGVGGHEDNGKPPAEPDAGPDTGAKEPVFIHHDAYNGQYAKVIPALKSGADINARDEQGRTPLHYAVSNPSLPNLDMAVVLIRAGADVNAEDNLGKTPLALAADTGHKNVIGLLQSAGATGLGRVHLAAKRGDLAALKDLIGKTPEMANTTDHKGWTPLHWAAAGGNMDAFNFLLDKGLSPTRAGTDGSTPLLIAAREGNLDIARALLDKGANPDAINMSMESPIAMAAASENQEMVELLIERGADLKTIDALGRTPLHLAAKAGNEKILKMLISAGADPNAIDNDGLSPLSLAAAAGQFHVSDRLREAGGVGTGEIHFAARQGDVAMVSVVLGRDPGLANAKTETDSTPLHGAAASGSAEVTKMLIDSEAEVDAVDRDGVSPLMAAAQSGKTEAAKILIGRGADVGRRDARGYSSLHLAAESNSPFLVKLLIDRGADIDAAAEDKTTPLHHASQAGIHASAALINAGAKADPRDRNGYSPLHFAARQGHTDLAAMLIKNGADPKAQTNDGKKPIDLARRCLKPLNCSLLIAVLKKYEGADE